MNSRHHKQKEIHFQTYIDSKRVENQSLIEKKIFKAAKGEKNFNDFQNDSHTKSWRFTASREVRILKWFSSLLKEQKLLSSSWSRQTLALLFHL